MTLATSHSFDFGTEWQYEQTFWWNGTARPALSFPTYLCFCRETGLAKDSDTGYKALLLFSFFFFFFFCLKQQQTRLP